MVEPQDEVSLRELYLILRDGLAWIVGVSFAVALITFLIMFLQPDRYEATASVRVAPLQLQNQTLQNGQVQQGMLDVNSVTQMGFDAFRTIAMSHAVLAATLKAAPSVPADLTPKRLAGQVSVSQVSGNGSDPLIVSQSVTMRDPKLAAGLANAWAQASAEAAQSSIGKALGHIRTTVHDQLANLSSNLNDAEAKWTAFQKQDERDTLQAQLTALNNRITTAQGTLDDLQRSIARTRAEQSLLQAVVAARAEGQRADLSNQVQALRNQGVIGPTLAQQLTDAISSVPPGTVGANQDLATLVARVQLQQRTADLAGYVAQRSTIQQQLDGFAKQGSDLRSQLASQQQTAQRLQRNLDDATRAYDKIYELAPLLDIADKLAPTMASVFNAASAPEQPLGHRTAVVTVVAFVLAFFVMTVIVFLRAAVTEQTESDTPRGENPGRRPAVGPTPDEGSPTE